MFDLFVRTFADWRTAREAAEAPLRPSDGTGRNARPRPNDAAPAGDKAVARR